MYYFTSDEHYGHKNIIQHCNRPYKSIEEMDESLISLHNSVVKDGDTVIHGGDFCFTNKIDRAQKYIQQLNGNHIFLKGSHDHWLKDAHEIWEKKVGDEYIVVCHYAMRVWPKSHFNSWQLYGHSHGKLKTVGKQWDIGVDNNDFLPVSLNRITEIMNNKPDNPNRIYPRGLLKPVTMKFYKALQESIENALESQFSSYNYEVRYVEEAHYMMSWTDMKKVSEVYSYAYNSCILNDLVNKFNFSVAEGSTDDRVPVEEITRILDSFKDPNRIEKRLQLFLSKCFLQGLIPTRSELIDVLEK